MNIVQGSLVVINLGMEGTKYLWNGRELEGVTKVFVYNGDKLTITVKDKSVIPVSELKASGIKVKVGK